MTIMSIVPTDKNTGDLISSFKRKTRAFDFFIKKEKRKKRKKSEATRTKDHEYTPTRVYHTYLTWVFALIHVPGTTDAQHGSLHLFTTFSCAVSRCTGVVLRLG